MELQPLIKAVMPLGWGHFIFRNGHVAAILGDSSLSGEATADLLDSYIEALRPNGKTYDISHCTI